MDSSQKKLDDNIFITDLKFIHGISCIRTGFFTQSHEKGIVCATQGGELKICSWNSEEHKWIQDTEFDLSENGAIWSMECCDINDDGIDEIIIGGMQGVVICVDAKGSELWTQNCSSSISGIRIWNGSSNPNKSHVRIVILSLDRTLRVLDVNGKLMWAQMFAAGVACVDIGDCDKDGSEEVVAGGNDGTLRIFDGHNGKIKWFKTLTQNIRSLLVVDYKIFCGGDDRAVSIYDGITQNLLMSKEYPTFVWNLRRFSSNQNIILMSTYSFKFMGDDENEGDPAIQLLNTCDLSDFWKKTSVNAQDIVLYNPILENNTDIILIIGDTGGLFSWHQFLPNGKLMDEMHTTLPSIINSVNIIEYEKSAGSKVQLFLAGCDDKILYTWKFEKGIKKC